MAKIVIAGDGKSIDEAAETADRLPIDPDLLEHGARNLGDTDAQVNLVGFQPTKKDQTERTMLRRLFLDLSGF